MADTADDDKEYLVAVVKKQLGLTDEEAAKKAAHIAHAKAAKIVAAGRAGDVATVRELLKADDQ